LTKRLENFLSKEHPNALRKIEAIIERAKRTCKIYAIHIENIPSSFVQIACDLNKKYFMKHYLACTMSIKDMLALMYQHYSLVGCNIMKYIRLVPPLPIAYWNNRDKGNSSTPTKHKNIRVTIEARKDPTIKKGKQLLVKINRMIYLHLKALLQRPIAAMVLNKIKCTHKASEGKSLMPLQLREQMSSYLLTPK